MVQDKAIDTGTRTVCDISNGAFFTLTLTFDFWPNLDFHDMPLFGIGYLQWNTNMNLNTAYSTM